MFSKNAATLSFIHLCLPCFQGNQWKQEENVLQSLAESKVTRPPLTLRVISQSTDGSLASNPASFGSHFMFFFFSSLEDH